MRAPVVVVLEEWRRLVEQPKSVFQWPAWSEVDPLPTGKRVRLSRADLHTNMAEETTARVQLADRAGVGLEGLRLRLVAWAFRRNADVTATLEALRQGEFVTISRVDAWPSSPHMHSHKVKKTSGFRKLPAIIHGSHVHRFADNARLGINAFGPGPDANLPVACALLEPLESFRDFLRTVENEFKIDGLSEFLAPPGWQGMF